MPTTCLPAEHYALRLGKSMTVTAPQEVYLDVSINGQPTSMIARFVLRDGRLYANAKDLTTMGLALPAAQASSDADIELDRIDGLSYEYDSTDLRIALQLDDRIRSPYRFNARETQAIPPATSSRGMLLNYDAYTQVSPRPRTAIWTEWRYFSPEGVLSHTGLVDYDRHVKRYIRYDTSWTRSHPDTLSTWQFGDTITGSLSWSRAIRMGGIQWRRNFALRPDLVTFPIPNLRGSAVVPSALDLYINDVRQFSSEVPSGPFVLNQIPGINGAGQATVVTRDALGRSVATTVPLYVDSRLLAPGLSSYAFEVGFLRRRYGWRSFDYDRRLALSQTTGYGVNSSLTLTSHAEATSGLFNAGIGSLVKLGMAGVVNAAVAASVGRFTGQQFNLGYQVIRPDFSINLDAIRTVGHYGDLAARAGDSVPSTTDRATLSLPLPRDQTLALSYIGFKLPRGPASRIASLSYLTNFGHLLSMNVSLFRNFSQDNTTGIFIGMNVGLGGSTNNSNGTSINMNFGRQNGRSHHNVNAIRTPNYAGGFGWAVQAGRTSGVNYREGQLQYTGNAGEVTAIGRSFAGHADTALDLSGAFVWMDGGLLMSRRINDSFAVVSTDGIADVPVLHENRVIGKTNRHGRLLVPDLNAYQHNAVAIDTMDLPANVRVSTTTRDLVPEARAGVLGHFGLPRHDAATVILYDGQGQPLPTGSRVLHAESGIDTIVGYDGITFIDQLKARNTLRVRHGAMRCVVTFDYRRQDDGGLPTIGPLVCQAGPKEPAAHASSRPAPAMESHK